MSARLEAIIKGSAEYSEQRSRASTFAEISQNLDRIWLASKERGEGIEFLDSILPQLPSVESDLPPYLRIRGETVYERQQPSLSEAIRETAKRLKFIQRLTSNLPDSVRGVIVGGSLSYGRFYNVRGLPNPSDVDIFVVVDSDFFEKGDGNLLVSVENGFSEQTVEDYSRRTNAFKELYARGEVDLMSIKTLVDDFLASLKILPFETFKNEFDTQLESASGNSESQVVGIRDYKQGAYPIRTFIQYNFLHEPFYFEIEESYPVAGGAITTLPLLIVKDDKMYTGQHHNHVIPRMEIEFDRSGNVGDILSRFSSYLKSRYAIEKKRSPGPNDMSFLNCHDRRDILSPYVFGYAKFFEE